MNEFPINPSDCKDAEKAVKALCSYLRRKGIRSVLLGLSGGADSTLTLHLLAESGRGIDGFHLGVAHANFGLRGEESDRDQRFVSSLENYYKNYYKERGHGDISFHYRHFDTLKHAREKKISVEMAARELRHDWWDALCAEKGYALIVTGHNADDNEETLFLNLMRGASPHGLRGMRPLGDRILRPLLGLHRAEILELLSKIEAIHEQENGFPREYVTDSSNLTSEYQRNFIRRDVLPLLSTRWPGIHKALQNVIRMQSEDADVIDYAVEQFISENATDSGLRLSWEALRKFPAPAMLIYRWLAPRGLSSTDAREAASHIPAHNADPIEVASFGSRWRMDDGSELIATPYGLRVVENSRDIFSLHYEGHQPEWRKLPLTDELFKRIKGASTKEIFLPNPPEHYEWRTPRNADRMRLFPDRDGRIRSKLVSDILREAGIPASSRKDVAMLVNVTSGEPVWIPGIRRAGADLISPDSDFVYHLSSEFTNIPREN